jgi:DNA-binding response OmpR family regulator
MTPHPSSFSGSQGAGPVQKSLRVLVVDDDRDAVLSVMMLLREEGHEVRGIYAGNDVLKALRDFEADVVLLDIGMPDRNGYDVARQIRSRYGAPRPILIALTAWTKASDRMLAEMAGFNHHLGKPYQPAELLALLAPLRLPTPGES